ncbi:hypothetical protein R3P38DRAFT_2803684 [Favolaschia claudopus]|uniref:Uncharacterized protein n=1 Tax=Favolaschia claudopus TaxID=2862362 RepID=A0AAV9Z7U9_9AGAR
MLPLAAYGYFGRYRQVPPGLHYVIKKNTPEDVYGNCFVVAVGPGSQVSEAIDLYRRQHANSRSPTSIPMVFLHGVSQRIVWIVLYHREKKITLVLFALSSSPILSVSLVMDMSTFSATAASDNTSSTQDFAQSAERLLWSARVKYQATQRLYPVKSHFPTHFPTRHTPSPGIVVGNLEQEIE